MLSLHAYAKDVFFYIFLTLLAKGINQPIRELKLLVIEDLVLA